MIPADRRYVQREIDRAIAALEKRLLVTIAAGKPRRTEFTLTDIAAGTGTTQAVSWGVPIPGNYQVVVSVTCAAAAVGLVTAGVQAGSKTPTGCTLIIANRTGAQLGTAAFDVLAFPL